MRGKRTTILTLFVVLLAGLIFVAGAAAADSGADKPPKPGGGPKLAMSGPFALKLHFRGLENLGSGWQYEGWVIVDGQPVSTGTFTVDGHGRLSSNQFVVDVDPADVSAFVLTIEPDPDPDPAPSAVHVLAGDFSGRAAHLLAGHPAALGSSFRSVGGSYILAAPSDPGAPYTQGIWWLDPDAGPGPSLNLPTLPAGWVYEGWVVGPNGPISTGRFTDPAAADSDGGGPAAGPHPTPPFPGQDFVEPATDLVGYNAVISIEPEPDNSPAPFTFKPLVDEIEDPGAPATSQMMQNNARAFPRGVAVVRPLRRYSVTIENVATGQPLSPPVFATHRGSVSIFNTGTYASEELEAIAEDGDQSGMANLLGSLWQVTDVVDVGMPLTPHGTSAGDFADSYTFEIYARPGDQLSFAGMLICSNDGFTGLDGVRLPKRGSTSYDALAYDAGTEDNTEMSQDIVDPCSALGPAPLPGDPDGNEDAAVDTQPPQPVHAHDGIVGNGELLPAHNWDGPIARVTITYAP